MVELAVMLVCFPMKSAMVKVAVVLVQFTMKSVDG